MESVKRLICMLLAFLCIGGCRNRQTLTEQQPQDIVQPSQAAGECVLNAALAATGAKNNGIVQRSDLTGFNFAEVPTILIEMGFLSNPDEDARMETEEYRDKLAQGICNGIIDYFASVSDNQ